VPPEIAGVALAAPVIYEVRNCAFAPDVVGRCDVASFTSPSAVESMVERLGRVPLPAAAIGPTTRHALRGAGAVVVAEPVRPDFDDLACAIAEAGCGGA
jgi:uroporphyrinogen-III synthase